jgi:hypothetical protein
MVAQHAQDWNVNGNVGLVVGATDPQAWRESEPLHQAYGFWCLALARKAAI